MYGLCDEILGSFATVYRMTSHRVFSTSRIPFVIRYRALLTKYRTFPHTKLFLQNLVLLWWFFRGRACHHTSQRCGSFATLYGSFSTVYGSFEGIPGSFDRKHSFCDTIQSFFHQIWGSFGGPFAKEPIFTRVIESRPYPTRFTSQCGMVGVGEVGSGGSVYVKMFLIYIKLFLYLCVYRIFSYIYVYIHTYPYTFIYRQTAIWPSVLVWHTHTHTSSVHRYLCWCQ